MRFIKTIIGIISATVYGYLKYNIDGYWYGIPFTILVLCLIYEGNK